MIDGWREQQAIVLEQPLFPRALDMARDQMFGPVHAGDTAEPLKAELRRGVKRLADAICGSL